MIAVCLPHFCFLRCCGFLSARGSELSRRRRRTSVQLARFRCPETGREQGSGSERLLDADYTTYVTLSGGDQLKISSEEAFSSIYIIWNKIPGEWTLSAAGASYTLGQYGYLHEFVDLREQTGTAVNEATVSIPKDIAVCDIYAFTEGNLPDWVQVWQPPCQQADLMLFSTHSDDEQLFLREFCLIMPAKSARPYKSCI